MADHPPLADHLAEVGKLLKDHGQFMLEQDAQIQALKEQLRAAASSAAAKEKAMHELLALAVKERDHWKQQAQLLYRSADFWERIPVASDCEIADDSDSS